MRNFLYLTVFILTACGEPTALSPIDHTTEDTTVFARTTTFERDRLKRDATRANRNRQDPDRYIYDWEVDKAYFTERAPRITVQPINTDSGANISVIPYEVTASNRPPVFNKDCLEEEDPVFCSNQQLKSFIQSIIASYEQEEIEFTREYDMVTFILDQKGKVLGDIFIAPQKEHCDICNKVAVRAVTKMDKWVPAFKNGMPVSVRIQVPIRYK